MRVVSYTRFTSDDPTIDIPSNVIQLQTDTINKYAEDKGWKIEKKYSDRRHDREECAAFEELRKDGVARKFDLLVITSMCRLGKGTAYAVEMLGSIFYPAGIHFAVTEDDFCSLEHSADEVEKYIFRSLRVTMSKKSHDPNNVTLSAKEIARQGLRYGYYYSRDLNKLVIDEEAAETIRLIFERFLTIKKYAPIARELEEKGVTAPTDRKMQNWGKEMNSFVKSRWTSAAIKRILTQPLYTGKGIRRVMGEQTLMEAPKIIEQEVFEQAQNIIKEIPTKSLTWKTEPANVLNNKVLDGDTGQMMMTAVAGKTCRDKYFIHRKAYRNITKEMMHNKQYIPYLQVVDSVREQLLEEQGIARIIDRRVSGLNLEDELKMLLLPLEEKMKRLIEQSLIFSEEWHEKADQKSAAEEQLAMLNKQIEEIMNMEKTYCFAFSRSNQWIKHYRDMKLSDPFVRKEVRKYIDTIKIYQFEEIEFVPFHLEWKNLLPEEWIQEARREYRNGKEKQKN